MGFGETTRPVGRKEHRCEFCYGPIPKGEKHPQFKGMWEGEWQNWRMHEECYRCYVNSEPQDGFSPGEAEMPERVKLLVEG
jgi:hypothetical protein